MAPILEFFGRTHVLILHLPIGLIVGLVALEAHQVVRKQDIAGLARLPLMALLAATAVAAAVTGLIRSQSWKASDELQWHLILGVAFAVVCLTGLALLWKKREGAYRLTVFVAALLVAPVGHLGGGLTHGKDFLFEPFQAKPAASNGKPTGTDTPVQPLTSNPVFAPALAAFQSRCAECHGPERTKGGFALHTPDAVAHAIEESAIIPNDPARSEVMKRILLPDDAKGKMPPTNKPQLTKAEIDAIRKWIEQGAKTE